MPDGKGVAKATYAITVDESGAPEKASRLALFVEAMREYAVAEHRIDELKSELAHAEGYLAGLDSKMKLARRRLMDGASHGALRDAPGLPTRAYVESVIEVLLTEIDR